MTTATDTQAFYFRAMGFNEDINQCDICGKDDLKGTVRMLIVDNDGNEEGQLQAGVICAARRAGRKAGEIRSEAKAADAAVRGAWMLHQDARNNVIHDEGTRILTMLGLTRSLDTYDAWAKHPEFLATMSAWDAANPAPARPRGW